VSRNPIARKRLKTMEISNIRQPKGAAERRPSHAPKYVVCHGDLTRYATRALVEHR
jgi:hypothetical protein